MVPIRSRWHDGGVLEIPAGTPVRQAALAFALYGLRLEAEGISPAPIEATVTIAGKHGRAMGWLDMDARDARWMADTISAMLHQDYGPWRTEDLNRLLAKYGPEDPDGQSPRDCVKEKPQGEVPSVNTINAGRCIPCQQSATQERLDKKGMVRDRNVGQKGAGRDAGHHPCFHRHRHRLPVVALE